MAQPSRGTTTSTTQILVDWIALAAPQNGDSAVLSYSLEWDAGNFGTNFISLVGAVANSLATSFVVTDNLTVGHAY